MDEEGGGGGRERERENKKMETKIIRRLRERKKGKKGRRH